MKKRNRWMVTVDCKGRISIPAEIKRTFGIEPNVQFILFLNERDNLELRKWD